MTREAVDGPGMTMSPRPSIVNPRARVRPWSLGKMSWGSEEGLSERIKLTKGENTAHLDRRFEASSDRNHLQGVGQSFELVTEMTRGTTNDVGSKHPEAEEGMVSARRKVETRSL